MANWGVVSLANRRPLINSNKNKKHKIHNHAGTPSPMVPEKRPSTFRRHGHIFRHLCGPEEDEHDCREMGCERITINVSGLQFVTRRSILEAHPATVLGDPLKREPYYDHLREEYFFDRHRMTFESIFNYYLYGGKLKKPAAVADDVFLDECEFFEVEDIVIQEYKKDEGYTETTYEYPSNPFLAKIWGLFEYPELSRGAFAIGLVSIVATLVSIVTFTLETTLPNYKEQCKEQMAFPRINGSIAVNFTTEPPTDDDDSFDYERFFFIIETICNIWFTLEAIVRFVSCPNHFKFWKDFKNIVDIMAIVPYYVALIEKAMDDGACSAQNRFAFLRVIRLIRVFKLTKHSQGLQILLLTFQSSMEGLTLFFLTLMVCVLVFSSMIYYCEIGQEGTMINSIPGGFWWSIITMCTVGYGDVVPVGIYGKLVGTVCALSGVLTLAIPVPIITENFNKFYIHKTRAKPKDTYKPGLVEKAHKQLVKLTSNCKDRINCERRRSNDAGSFADPADL